MVSDHSYFVVRQQCVIYESHPGKTPKENTREEVGYGETTYHVGSDEYLGLFIDFKTVNVAAWWLQ